jgi:type IV pilus assembly protein PilQ
MRREHRKIKMGTKNWNLILFYIIGLTVFAAIATGQAEPNQPDNDQSVILEQQNDGMVFAAEPENMELDKTFTGESVQSINLRQDMPIKDALRFLAVKYRKNIIPSAKVNGKVNVANLYGVTFEEALDAVLGRDFYYEFGDNFIKVYTKDEYDEMAKDSSRMTSKAFALNYVNAAEIKALIMPVLSELGKIGTTTAAAVDTEAGKGGDTVSMKDTIVVYDYPERLDQISRMIKEIDVKPQQIMIEVTILSAELSETTQFGINWTKIGGLTSASLPFGISANLLNSAATAFTANLNNDEITAAITAQEGITDTTVLANPKIMALNKQAGYINIGEERGYTASTTQGQTTTTSVDFLISGTILKFRPFICEDGYIRMEINPELSTGSVQTDVNSTLPLKTITQVKSNIMVKDGRTIVIGGLFKEKLANENTQVPVVGDIPIIGALFKKTKDANLRTELVILITPHIIDESSDIAAKDKQEDISRIVNGSRKRMNSISRVRIYEDIYAKAVKYYSEKKYDKALTELNWIIGFRPNALEAVKLKEKIIAETNPDEYKTLERIMLEQVRKEQEINWSRR